MSREIKFRGLRVDGKGWVYGDLLCNWTAHQILSDEDGNEYLVIPETVGQFIGLKDLNGKEIYEGDVLKYYHYSSKITGFQKVFFGWYYTYNDGRCNENVMGWVDEDGCPIDTQENKYTIVGNIHSNE